MLPLSRNLPWVHPPLWSRYWPDVPIRAHLAAPALGSDTRMHLSSERAQSHPVNLILELRALQLEAGHTPERDEQRNPHGVLTMAAITYATAAASGQSMRNKWRAAIAKTELRHPMTGQWPILSWPASWDISMLKIGERGSNADRYSELALAGAFIVAEMERLQLRIERGEA